MITRESAFFVILNGVKDLTQTVDHTIQPQSNFRFDCEIPPFGRDDNELMHVPLSVTSCRRKFANCVGIGNNLRWIRSLLKKNVSLHLQRWVASRFAALGRTI